MAHGVVPKVSFCSPWLTHFAKPEDSSGLDQLIHATPPQWIEVSGCTKESD